MGRKSDPLSPMLGDACGCVEPCDCELPKSTDLCVCDPCDCETPPTSPLNPPATPVEDFCTTRSTLERGFSLNEFVRAKEYFMTASTNSGLNLYDHVSEVLRQMLDSRAPPNSVDFLEEISLNLKRYRFGKRDLVIDSHYISPSLVEDATTVLDNWKKHAQWSRFQSDMEEAGEYEETFGGFPNLMRLLYYLEQINVGLPRQEMFRIALALRQLNVTHPVRRSRFWGKIFGTERSYYVVEAELGRSDEEDMWVPCDEDPNRTQLPPTGSDTTGSEYPSAASTYDRARSAVTDPDILIPYQETSGLPPNPANCVIPNSGDNEYFGEDGIIFETVDPDAIAESKLWASFQKELMEGFPTPPKFEQEVVIPAEAIGEGVNRRAFYITNELHERWLLLPPIMPKHIQVSRNVRHFLTGNLDASLEMYPEFDGREGHYLKALLARATAGSQVSPKGYFRRTPPGEEEEEEEDEDELDDEEDEDEHGQQLPDTVYHVKKFRPPPMLDLIRASPNLWVHHTGHILRQGRTTWWNPGTSSGQEYEDELLGEEDEDEQGSLDQEVGPPLFSSLADDVTFEGYNPWSIRASSTVFQEFQIASVRSNVWPGASAFCTRKGKVENIYFGDSLKFRGTCFAPKLPANIQAEYQEGPELTEVTDPTYAEEQNWLNKLELETIKDVEDKFQDNEVPVEDDSTTDYDGDDTLTDEDDGGTNFF